MKIGALGLQQIKSSLFKGTIASVAVRASGHVLRFLLGVLLARVLGAESFGMYSFAIAVVSLISIPGMLGMDHITIRFLGEYFENKRLGLVRGMVEISQRLVFVAGIVVSVLAAAFFLIAQDETRSPTAMTVILLALATVPLVVASQTRQALCRGLHRPVLAQIPENLIYPGTLALFFLAGVYWMGAHENVFAASIANILAWGVAWIAGLWLLHRAFPPALKEHSRENELKKWLAMTPGVVMASGAFLVLTRTDVLVLDAFYTPREVGLYVAAARGAELSQFLYEAATLAGTSMFASLYAAGDRAKVAHFIVSVSRIIFWGSLPIVVVFLVFSEMILGIFGAEYVEASTAFRVLTLAYYISGIGGFVIPMMYIVGRQRELAVTIWAFAALNLVLCLVLVPSFGTTGAACAFGVSLIGLKFTLMIRLYVTERIVCLPFTAGNWSVGNEAKI